MSKTNKTEHRATHLKGEGISPGAALGRAFIYRDILQRGVEYYSITESDVEEEWLRVQKAVEQVQADLQKTADKIDRRIDDNDASGIFVAQQAMLSDPALTEDFKQTLATSLVNAEHVVQQVMLRWERIFQQKHREKNKEISGDIADLARRLLLVLEGIHAHSLEKIPKGSVLIAKRLLPSDTVFLSRNSTLAIVVEHGGKVSHAAILTRELGIPGVSQVGDLLDKVQPGDTVFVDGNKGEVIIDPDEQSREKLTASARQARKQNEQARAACMAPALTLSGNHIELMANVGCREDVELAAENGADGIGLYRTEHIYMTRQSPPSEENTVHTLKQALAPVKNQQVTLRLLDAGGDKNIPFLNIIPEYNPFLGRRGIRLLLHHPDLLKTQLRIFLQLSEEYDIRILVPMVTVPEDMKRTREILESTALEINCTKTVELGAMIETPAAALCVPEIAEQADFFSIGTNDLTQYTMVAGRENPQVSDYFIDNHKAVMRLLDIVIKEAGNKPVSLCGEIAGRPEELRNLIDKGIRSFSSAPALIPKLKERIRKI